MAPIQEDAAGCHADYRKSAAGGCVKYLSVCSGIEAATVAWHPLGWEAFAYSEIEAFPAAVLAHHYPNTPNFGDMTKFKEWPHAAIDLLVGGTPCQSFSVAGLRKGLDDPRGNLMLTYLAIAAKYRPTWLVWENVPGVLSSNGGRDFGTFLAGLGQLGYGFAYRVLDAQYFGVAQRRRRVFVIGCLGNWRAAAAVLSERASLSGNPAPSRETGEKITGTLGSRASSGGGFSTDFDLDGGLQLARCVTTGEGKRQDYETCTLVAHALRGEGFDASEDGTGRGTPLVPVAQPYTLAIRGRGDSHDLEYRQDGTANALLTPNGGRGGIGVGAIAYRTAGDGAVFEEGDATAPLTCGTDQCANVVAWSIMPQNSGKEYKARAVDVAQPIMAGGPVGGNQGGDYIQQAMQVRRLTPRECERLQGFQDDYTLIPYGRVIRPEKMDMDYAKYLMRGGVMTFEECLRAAADGPRYKALGNSMAVPVMHWIGRRIDLVSAIPKLQRTAA
jgi:DNA (cytosine-5)-methyltransferase 1